VVVTKVLVNVRQPTNVSNRETCLGFSVEANVGVYVLNGRQIDS
jgi:hypothetical protein